uniref:Reverse transcriptase domain-containing protein n=1 Tax=Strongyloides venezuelensis TaxID=75913 RepID=A0A0K0FRH7_STRVS
MCSKSELSDLERDSSDIISKFSNDIGKSRLSAPKFPLRNEPILKVKRYVHSFKVAKEISQYARPINSLLENWNYPTNSLNERLVNLHGAVLFSKIDLRQFFLQIPDEEGAELYQDDILLFSNCSDKNKHLPFVRKCLNALRSVRLKLNFQKSQFCLSKLDYLPFTISGSGRNPCESYVSTLKNFPIPGGV